MTTLTFGFGLKLAFRKCNNMQNEATFVVYVSVTNYLPFITNK